MLNNFRVFEELVFFDLWIPDSGFRFPGFRVTPSVVSLYLTHASATVS